MRILGNFFPPPAPPESSGFTTVHATYAVLALGVGGYFLGSTCYRVALKITNYIRTTVFAQRKHHFEESSLPNRRLERKFTREEDLLNDFCSKMITLRQKYKKGDFICTLNFVKAFLKPQEDLEIRTSVLHSFHSLMNTEANKEKYKNAWNIAASVIKLFETVYPEPAYFAFLIGAEKVSKLRSFKNLSKRKVLDEKIAACLALSTDTMSYDLLALRKQLEKAQGDSFHPTPLSFNA
ncbi:MAG: hypothetical protein KR126chlam1_00532 [Chlamydiae bacterium]|nr:hypothetical protein [Chlamydiota bacterium]